AARGRRAQAARGLRRRSLLARLFGLVFLDVFLRILVESVPAARAADVVGHALVRHRDRAQATADNALHFFLGGTERLPFFGQGDHVILGEDRPAFRLEGEPIDEPGAVASEIYLDLLRLVPVAIDALERQVFILVLAGKDLLLVFLVSERWLIAPFVGEIAKLAVLVVFAVLDFHDQPSILPFEAPAPIQCLGPAGFQVRPRLVLVAAAIPGADEVVEDLQGGLRGLR